MAIDGALKSRFDTGQLDMEAPVSRADLAIGMQLLRASNMKALRLQLALIKRDRASAMDAVDGLVELDAEIASFVADMPPADVCMREMGEISHWIDEQKRAIASEKLVLGCLAEGPGVQQSRRTLSSAPVADHDGHHDEVMDLRGFELGSKRILADIEARAFNIESTPEAGNTTHPERTADNDDRIHLSPAQLKDLSTIEANGRELHAVVSDIDTRLKRLPGKRFIFVTVLAFQAALAALVVYGETVRPLIPVALVSNLPALSL